MSASGREALMVVALLWTLTLVSGVIVLLVGAYAIPVLWGTLAYPAWLIGFRMGQKEAS